MAEQKAKGSIIYEILIVVMAVLLIGSILYPKKVGEEETRNRELGRYRMSEIYKAGLQYQKYNHTYTDTLSQIFEFIRTSPEYNRYVDSLIVGGLDSVVRRLEELKMREDVIADLIPSAKDTVIIDSLTHMQDAIKLSGRELAGYVEFLNDRLKNLPNMPAEQLKETFVILDSKQFTLDMEIVKNSIESGLLTEAAEAADDVIAVMEEVKQMFQKVAERVPEYKSSSLDSLAICPTTGKEFNLVHIDTSVIKYLNIYSPIDSMDIAEVEGSFLKSKIGGLTLVNHGKIESGEKNWETTQ